jgi:glutaminyl-peptide cyclotransferase
MKRIIDYHMLKSLYLFTVVVALNCCNNNHVSNSGNETSSGHNEDKPSKTVKIITLQAPKSNSVFTIGQEIPLQINHVDASNPADSVEVYIQGNKIQTLKSLPTSFTIITKELTVGNTPIRIVAWKKNYPVETSLLNYTLLSDIIPKDLSWRLIKKYPHNSKSFTQGLVYENNILYESSGQWGESALRIVDIQTGNSTNMVNLEGKYFGEGIAINGDTIMQLTWTNHVAFIYDKSTLKLLNTINMEQPEGWGLAFNGTNYLLTDGSDRIYFLDPDTYSEIGYVDVFDNKGMVVRLNELEYVNGKVLANVLGESYIVVIDPDNGKVLGKVNLNALVPEGLFDDGNKVLNGIAYNLTTKSFYVTGKYWPVLYEIEIELD